MKQNGYALEHAAHALKSTGRSLWAPVETKTKPVSVPAHGSDAEVALEADQPHASTGAVPCEAVTCDAVEPHASTDAVSCEAVEPHASTGAADREIALEAEQPHGEQEILGYFLHSIKDMEQNGYALEPESLVDTHQNGYAL